MTLKFDAKFKGKLFRDRKNDIRNLISFHARIRESENFHLGWLVLSKTHKVLDEKV